MDNLCKRVKINEKRLARNPDIIINPSKQDMQKMYAISHKKESRSASGSAAIENGKPFIIARIVIVNKGKGDVYAVNPYDAIHQDILDATGMKQYTDYLTLAYVNSKFKVLFIGTRILRDFDYKKGGFAIYKKNKNLRWATTFADYNAGIDEDFAAKVYNAASHDNTIYINPSSSELREISKESSYDKRMYRGFVDRGGMGNLYMWSSDLNHTEAMKGLMQERGLPAMKNDILDIYFKTTDKTVHFSKWTPTIREMYPDIDFGTPKERKEEMEKRVAKKINDFWGKNIMRNSHFKNIGVRSVSDSLRESL